MSARGVDRRSHGPWVRMAGWLVAVALLLPIVLGVVSVLWSAIDG
jgi:hypothetical protein